MKDTSKGNMSLYINAAEERLTLLSGSISTLFEAMMLGAKGGVVSLANAFVDPCIRLYEACESADIQTARRLHYFLNNLSSSISGRFGVAGVKFAMELAGFYGGDPRRPLLPLNDVERSSIKRLIDRSGILSISN
jgi:4-hydroxy-2-oxoglutarate aldolase